MTTENLVGEKSGQSILCRKPWFTGREKELQTLADFLTGSSESPGNGGDRRVVVIRGEAGVGKTALVSEFCYRYSSSFDRIFWLHAEQDFADEIAYCGEAIGLPEWPDSLHEQIEFTLRAWETHPHWLVIMDNFLDALQAQEWLEKLQPAFAIITTRLEDPIRLFRTFELTLKPFDPDEAMSLLGKICPSVFHSNNKYPETNRIAVLAGYYPSLLTLAGCLLRDPSSGTRLSVFQQEWAEIFNPISDLSISSVPGNDLNWKLPGEWMAFSHLSEQLFVKETDRLKYLFCACGYCAPNYELSTQLLANAIRVEPSGCQELLDRLATCGLLERTPKGLVITPQMADFARWIGSMVHIDPLQEMINAWDDLLCYTQNEEKILHNGANLAHLKVALIYAITNGINKIGFILYFLGRYYQQKKALPLAEYYLKKAFEMDQVQYGLDHLKVGIISNILGNLALQQGKPADAVACFINALRIYGKNLSPDHPFILALQNNLERLGMDDYS